VRAYIQVGAKAMSVASMSNDSTGHAKPQVKHKRITFTSTTTFNLLHHSCPGSMCALITATVEVELLEMVPMSCLPGVIRDVAALLWFREREEQRTTARGKEAEAEERLRSEAACVSELRSKMRPVEEYNTANRAEQLKEAAARLQACKDRVAAQEENVKVGVWWEFWLKIGEFVALLGRCCEIKSRCGPDWTCLMFLLPILPLPRFNAQSCGWVQRGAWTTSAPSAFKKKVCFVLSVCSERCYRAVAQCAQWACRHSRDQLSLQMASCVSEGKHVLRFWNHLV